LQAFAIFFAFYLCLVRFAALARAKAGFFGVLALSDEIAHFLDAPRAPRIRDGSIPSS
jgi:hypothetical protein